MKRVTLDQLSAHLSLSKYSVSRALSGKGGVSDRTRRKVFDAARELGYNHPAVARPEATAERKIKLLIPRIDAVSSQFWGEVVAGAEGEARRAGFDLATHLIGDDGNDADVLRDTRGLILAGRRSRGLSEGYIDVGLPVVLIGHPTPFEQVDAVRASSWGSGYLIGRHFADLGHRHVAYITDAPDDRARQERLRGLRDAMAAVDGGTVVPHHYELGSDAGEALRRCLATEPRATALSTATDLVAMTIAWALRDMGLRIPRHVSLAGCNDLAVASQIGLRLTTVRNPMREIGAAAIQMMDWRLERAVPGEASRQLTLQPQFVRRESTAPPNPGELARALRTMGIAG